MVRADAEEKVIIAMGSVCDTIEDTHAPLKKRRGGKVGVIGSSLQTILCTGIIDAIPDTVKYINVLDRTKEPGAQGEPLYLDVVSALKGSKFDAVPVNGGRYGLGSKDTTPAQIVAVFNNADKKKRFTIGINDDVTNLSLEVGAPLVTTPEGTINCKFWGLGADGTVELTRTLSRSSVITQICMHRLTLIMTLRSLVVLQCLTCVSVRSQSNLLT